MPVDGCPLLRLRDLIMNGYLDDVSPVSLNRRSGKLVVNQKDGLLIPIGGYNSPFHCEIIPPDDPSVRGRGVRVAV